MYIDKTSPPATIVDRIVELLSIPATNRVIGPPFLGALASVLESKRLRPKEYFCLKLLLEHPGRVVSKTELLQRVWGQASAPSTTIVETTISRLRASLGPLGARIRGVPSRAGGGYVVF